MTDNPLTEIYIRKIAPDWNFDIVANAGKSGDICHEDCKMIYKGKYSNDDNQTKSRWCNRNT